MIKSTISLGLLALLLKLIADHEGIDALRQRLAHLQWSFVALAVVLHTLSMTFGIIRWRLLMDAQGFVLRWPWVIHTYLVGRFVGAATPSTTGLDLYRVIAATKLTGEVERSTTVVIAEKFLGLVGLATMFLTVLPTGAHQWLGRSTKYSVLAAALAGLAGLVVLLKPGIMRPLLLALPGGLRLRGNKVLDAITASGMTPRVLLTATLLGLAGHTMMSSVFAATAYAIGIDVHLAPMLVVGNMVILGTLLPITISGIGVRESICVFLLLKLDVAAADGALVGLLAYVTGQVPSLIGGLVSFFPVPAGLLARPAEQTENPL